MVGNSVESDAGTLEDCGVLMRPSQGNETHRLRVNYARVSQSPHLCAKDNVLDVG
jgi:hypothetical protein